MSIVAILATVGATGYGIAMEKTRRAQAHTDCMGLANGLEQYRLFEGPFPGEWATPRDTSGPFLAALVGGKSVHNRTGEAYFPARRVTSDPRAHGFVVGLGQYNDPWGKPYRVHLGTGRDEVLSLPPAYHGVFGETLPGKVVFVYSAGRDGRWETIHDNVTSVD